MLAHWVSALCLGEDRNQGKNSDESICKTRVNAGLLSSSFQQKLLHKDEQLKFNTSCTKTIGCLFPSKSFSKCISVDRDSRPLPRNDSTFSGCVVSTERGVLNWWLTAGLICEEVGMKPSDVQEIDLKCKQSPYVILHLATDMSKWVVDPRDSSFSSFCSFSGY